MNFLRRAAQRQSLTRSRRRRLDAHHRIESLESRRLLVGQVSAVVRGDDLIIEGDESGNQIEVSVFDGNVAVRPKNGTRINGVRGRFEAFVGTDTIPGDLIIKMNQGDDTVILARGLIVQNDVRVDGGRGADTLGLDNARVRNDLIFNGGRGADGVSIEDSRIVDDLKLRLDDGNDTVRISTSDIFDDTKIKTGDGVDAIVIDDVDFNDNLKVRTGKGDDVLDINAARVDGDLKIKTRRDDDLLELTNSRVSERVSINMGSGNDNVRLGVNDDNGDPTNGNVFRSPVKLNGGDNGPLPADPDDPFSPVDPNAGGGDYIDAQVDNNFRDKRRESGFEFENLTNPAVTSDDANDRADAVRDAVLDLLIPGVQDLTVRAADDTVTVESVGTLVTKLNTIDLRGRTTVGSTVEVDADGDGDFDDGTTMADGRGLYTLLGVPLVAGRQVLNVRSIDARDRTQTADLDVHMAEGSVVRFSSTQGDFDYELLDADAPITVENFKNYFERYTDSIVHRSIRLATGGIDVVQGGGFTFENGRPDNPIPTDPPIMNEFTPANSNVRGTISTALSGGDINSATAGWFFNSQDNTGLDAARHTVFGRPIGDSLDIVDDIAAVATFNINNELGIPPSINFSDTPLDGYTEFSEQLTGTVSGTAAGSTITGSGTMFTTELNVGSEISINGEQFVVTSISDDTQLTINGALAADVNGVAALTNPVPVEDNYVIFRSIAELLDTI